MRSIFSILFKPIVIILLDSYKRDKKNAKGIKSKFELNGFAVFIASRRNFFIASLILRPKNIYIIGQLEMGYSVSRIINTNIYLSPAEAWTCDFFGDQYFPPDSKYYKSLRCIFVWNQDSIDWLRKNRSSQLINTKLVLSGFPRSSYLYELRKLRSTQIPKKKIGFVSNFSTLNDLYSRKAIEFFLDGSKNNYTEYTKQRINIEIALAALYSELYQLPELSDFLISIRPHPTENPITYKKYFKDVSSKDEVTKWLSSIDCIVGPVSTMVYEAWLAGVPYLCTDYLTDSIKDAKESQDFYKFLYALTTLPRNNDELIQSIKKFSSSKYKVVTNFNPENNSINKIIEYNSGSIDIIASSCLNGFSKRNDYISFLKIITIYLIDYTWAVYHSFFKPFRLLFDYSRLHDDE